MNEGDYRTTLRIDSAGGNRHLLNDLSDAFCGAAPTDALTNRVHLWPPAAWARPHVPSAIKEYAVDRATESSLTARRAKARASASPDPARSRS
jgi:hypothetical protein